MTREQKTNEEKAKELAKKWSTDNAYNRATITAIEMAEWKDKQPINELGGWHTEEPTEDGWYLVDTPDFPKNCHCIVAEWDNDAKHFYSESSDFPVDFKKWKLIERR